MKTSLVIALTVAFVLAGGGFGGYEQGVQVRSPSLVRPGPNSR